MAIVVFDIPIPVVVDENGVKKEGYALYAESGGMHERDCWTVVWREGGVVRHYLTNDVRVQYNGTYSIVKEKKKK